MKPISILGIAYDGKSSFLKGPALAPTLIRQCLHSGSSHYYAINGVDVSNDFITDKGDFKIEDYFDIEKIAGKHLADSRLMSIGGDHSITYPLIRAYKQFYPSIHILHIDAHTDLYDELDGDRLSHACPFARIMEEKLADRLVQVGIRTLNPHQKEQADRFGAEIIDMKNFEISKVPEFSQPIYISLDLDAIDPAFAPGVSHHEPGGLTSREIIDLIDNIKVPIIGADIVEYNPIRDVNGITVALATRLLKEILSKMIENG